MGKRNLPPKHPEVQTLRVYIVQTLGGGELYILFETKSEEGKPTVRVASPHTVEETILEVEFQGQSRKLNMIQRWPVRQPQPGLPRGTAKRWVKACCFAAQERRLWIGALKG